MRLPRIPRTFLPGALALLAAPVHAATTWYVDVGGAQQAFSPQVVTIHPGDTVVFQNHGGVHNVVADDGRFRCAIGCDNDGAGGTGAPTGYLWNASVTFPDPGIVGYFCETHGSPNFGMYGTVRVVPTTPAALPPSAVPAVGVAAGGALALGLVLLARRSARRARSAN